MNEEQWNELLELRYIADLSPKFEFRLQRLESLLSSSFHLDTYSAEERIELLAQFKGLSEQEQKDLVARVKNKPHANFFHLSDEEREKLKAARPELSLQERARLSGPFIYTNAGVALLDIAEAFNAKIEIDDNSSIERETCPYAYIYFSHHYQRRVETIDILESVRKDATAISHPVVAFAIYHWQRIINAKRVFEREDVITSDEWEKLAKEMWGGLREVRIAENNLKALGKALVEGAKNRAIPNETALSLKMESLGLGVNDKNTVLHKAWERLDSRFIERTDETEQMLVKIEAELQRFERQPYSDNRLRRIDSARVMQFLKDGGETGGSRYVGNSPEGVSLRPRWKVFLNAFAAWYFGIKQGVLQGYLEKAGKQDVADKEVYRGFGISPTSDVPSIFSYLLTLSLEVVREPIWLHESDIGFHGIPKAIENALSGEESEE